MSDFDNLLQALQPLVSRLRQDATWFKKPNQKGFYAKKGRFLNENTLVAHLNSNPITGACPIKEGESTTRVAVLDLDSHKGEITWPEMVRRAKELTTHFESLDMPCTAFRSTGGNGIHLIFLFNPDQECYAVRQFFEEELIPFGYTFGTRGLVHNEIEIFPKQDSVPIDGFGNQFALPFAGKSLWLDPIDLSPVEKENTPIDIWRAAVPVPKRQKPEPKAKQSLPSIPSSELEEILNTIPNTENNYDLWIKVGMAIKTETGDTPEGLALWEQWSEQCPDYSGFDELQYKWDSFRDDKDSLVTVGTLKTIAREHGWQEDFSSDFAEVKPDPVLLDKFELIPFSQMAHRKPVEWLIKGIVPRGKIGVTFGASGDGKTFAVFDQCMAIVRGVPWNGHKTTKGRVVYICAEGAGGFVSRMMAYCLKNDISPETFDDDFFVIPATPNFRTMLEVELVAKKINAKGPFDMVVVDTFAQVSVGADENSGKEIGVALKHCEILGELTNSVSHLIAHAGKDISKGIRGWSGLKAPLDFNFCVYRDDVDKEKRNFWIEKLKDGRDNFGYTFTLKTQVVLEQDDDGDVVESCVVEYNGKSTSTPATERTMQSAQQMDIFEYVAKNVIANSNESDFNALTKTYLETFPSAKREMAQFTLIDAIEAAGLHIKDGKVYSDLTA